MHVRQQMCVWWCLHSPVCVGLWVYFRHVWVEVCKSMNVRGELIYGCVIVVVVLYLVRFQSVTSTLWCLFAVGLMCWALGEKLFLPVTVKPNLRRHW